MITADEVNYDRTRSLVIAKGNVQISQGARILRADSIVYNQRTKTVYAYGHVSLSEPSGQVVFAERIELKDDLREGVVENFRMLFPDDTKVAANSAVRSGGNRTVMNKVVFSPCRLCPENPTRAPLWQIKARRVVHDQEARDIWYYDAWMEVFGLPVFYSPYFRHPDPTVKRRTGFLAPSYGNDSELGFSVRAPYFIVLGPDKDLTLAPVVFSKVRPALFAAWRHRVVDGEYDVRGSFTYVRRRDATGAQLDQSHVRGHFFTRGLFDINDTWRWGFDGGWTTDDTYMRRYNVSSTSSIVSTAFVEGFRGRNYAAARLYHFQGLRTTDFYSDTPIIFPLVDYSVVSTPLGAQGQWGRWTLDLNVMALSRVDGDNSRRLSIRAGWELPHITTGGHVFRVGARLQSDFYWVHTVRESAIPGKKFTGITGRVFPVGYAEWRYPLVRELGNVRNVIEPRVALIMAPNWGNPFKIPNEDSRDVELDDVNLFSLSRFNGLDRVERGPRIVYGVSTSFYGNRGGKTELFVGNSLSFLKNRDFPDDSGLERQLADLVGRFTMQPSQYLQFVYRFRLSTEELKARRHEISAVAGPPALRVGVGYFFFEGTEGVTTFPTREEVFGSVVAQVTKNWGLVAGARWDLTEDGGPLSWTFGATFKNECCQVIFTFTRSFTTDRDVKATNRFFLRIVLKHLGEISTSQ